jgi:hypothetical protein
MFHRKGLFLSRRKFIVPVVILVAAAGALAFHHRKLWPMVKGEPVAQGGPAMMAYVPPGIPVGLSNFSITNADPGNAKNPYQQAIRFRASASGGEALVSLNLALFEFDAKALLKRVAGWVRTVDLQKDGTVEMTLPFERRLSSEHRLVLVVERAGSGRRRWEANFNDLAKQATNITSGKTLSQLLIKESDATAEDSGSALCLSGLRRARALAQISDTKGTYTSYTCDQHQGSFAFTFSGKSL